MKKSKLKFKNPYISENELCNVLIQYAKDNNYDYLFMVDSDLVLHPETLKTLIEAQKDVIFELYFSKWTPEDVWAPNVWDYDLYGFNPDIETRIQQFQIPGMYEVGMGGACTLIRKAVLQAGINYDKVPNVNFWGEDRHFCIQVASHKFKLWVDTHFPALHLYRKSDVENHKKVGEINE